ncbi:Leucine-rich receptor-like protein kinase family protein [Rhynchospora pubera]|uniref:Leucine-rich receptor-like protein kinase family protein n=1 Tax=Rhynchospora pubera TaxID=906938 RepID=A0AAV8F1T8_9POAL|nr:Leucine-rich receptor-like protein kinase family protein [Rhynchospora pubera]
MDFLSARLFAYPGHSPPPHKAPPLCSISPIFLLLLLLLFLLLYRRLTHRIKHNHQARSIETAVYNTVYDSPDETEDLITFPGGEDLTASDILEAPGEVIGRSSYGTVYRACLRRTGSTVLLRFVRPTCIGSAQDIVPVVKTLASVTHGNLVPLKALYVGPRGEKLFVHPFYAAGTLAQFLRDGVVESQRWEITCKLSLGITKGLDCLHTGYSKPIIHGNIKTNNILLDENLEPRLSDFGLHLLLSPTAGQEMLEAFAFKELQGSTAVGGALAPPAPPLDPPLSALRGYKAPELMKIKDATKETDVYSLGVVLLEMLTQRDPIKILSLLHSKDLVFEREISEVFKGCGNGEGLLEFFRLAMDCCVPVPGLRPDVKSILKRLEEISR